MRRKSWLWGVILFMGVTALLAHPADPDVKLNQYAMYATDTVMFSDQMGSGDTVKFAPAGYVGSGGCFDMKKIPWVAGKVYFYDSVFVGGSSIISNAFILPDAGPFNLPIVSSKQIVVDKDASITNLGAYPTSLYQKTRDLMPPVANSTTWYNVWPSDSINKTGTITTDVNVTSRTTITPGHYGTITVNVGQTLILKPGNYEINSLVLGGSSRLLVDKTKDEFCRIFVRDNLTYQNNVPQNGTGPIIKAASDTLAANNNSDLGNILIYSTAQTITGLPASTGNYSYEINASIIAPRAKITFETFPVLRGQIMARVLSYQGAFNATLGTFKKFDNANVIMADMAVNEDQTTATLNSVDRSYDITIPVALDAFPVSTKTATMYYHLEPTSSKFANFATTATDTSKRDGTIDYWLGTNAAPVFPVAVGKFPAGMYTFNSSTKSFYINVHIVDDSEFEGNETFKIVVDSVPTTGGNYTINGTPLFSTISISDDDPKNSAPDSISLSNLTIKEAQPAGTIVGILKGFDKDSTSGDTLRYDIIGGNGYFTIDATKRLVTTAGGANNIDYESPAKFYDVEVKVTDRGLVSISKTFRIDILPVNDKRDTTKDTSYTVSETGSLTNVSLPTPKDLDLWPTGKSNKFRYVLVKSPSNSLSAFTLVPNGTFSYTPKSAGVEIKADTLTYFCVDSSDYTPVDTLKSGNVTGASTAIITISPVNDEVPAILRDSTYSDIWEGETRTIDIATLVSDLDIPKSTITGKVVTGKGPRISGSTASFNGTVLTYTHDKTSEQLRDTVEFTVNDGVRDAAVSRQVFLEIQPLNDNKPVANNKTIIVNENSVTPINVMTANTPDTDADMPTGATTKAVSQVLRNPQNGTGTVAANGAYTYTNNGVIGKDTLIYVLSDAVTYKRRGNIADTIMFDTAVVEFNVQRINTPPTTGNSSFTFVEQDPVQTITLEIGAGKQIVDANKGDALTLVSATNTQSKAGTVLLGVKTSTSDAGQFTLTYTPTKTDSIEVLADTITYTVRDAAGSTASGKVFIVINPINDNKTAAVKDSTSAVKGASVSINVMTNDTINEIDLPNNGNIYSVALVGPDGGAKQGTASLTSAGVLTYTSNTTGGLATDTLKYVLTDDVNYPGKTGFGPYTDTGIVIITVTPNFSLNTPTAKDTTLLVQESNGSAASVTMLSTMVNDADVANGDALTLTYIAPKYGTVTPASGTVLTAGAKLTYTYNQVSTVEKFADTIIYTVTDKGVPAGVASDTIFIGIDTLNDNAPVVPKTTVTNIPFGKVTTISLPTITDFDEPKSMNKAVIDSAYAPLTFNGIKTAPKNGDVSWISPTSFGYKPFITTSAVKDSFEYQVLDSVSYDLANSQRTTAWIVMTLDQTSKDKPIAGDTTLYLDEGDSVLSFDLMANLCKVGAIGAALDSVTLVSTPTLHKGTFTLPKLGVFTYTHNSDEKFIDSLKYTVTDKTAGTGLVSSTGTVYFKMKPLNDNKQTIAANSSQVDEKDSVKVTVIEGSDADIDTATNLVLTGMLVDPTAVKYGSVTFNPDNKTILYVVDSSKTGNMATGQTLVDTFSVWTADSVSYNVDLDYTKPETHKVANKVTITIAGLNDNAPAGAVDTLIEVNEGDSTVLDLTTIITDVDKDALVVSVSPLITSTGSVSVSGKKITYTHNDDEQFTDKFTYTVSDGIHDTTKTVTVTILPLNDDTTTIKGDSLVVAEKKSRTINVSANNYPVDQDINTTLKYEIVKNGVTGTATIDSLSGELTYKSADTLEITSEIYEKLLIKVTDPVTYDPTIHTLFDTVYVTITPVNDHDPVITARATEDVLEGKTSTVIDLRSLVTDADGDSPKITVKSAGKFGKADSAGVDKVVYNHNGTEPSALNSVIDTLTFTASDADTTIEGTVLFRIMNRNDSKAEGNRDQYDVNETDTLVVVKANGVLKNDTDADLPASENILIATIADQAKNGDVTLAKDGSFSYIPQAKGDEFAADSFTYFLKDSTTYDNVNNSSNPVKYTVLINVINENDEKPGTQPDTIDVKEGESAVTLRSGDNSVLANDTLSIEKDALTATLLDSTTSGTLILNSDGTFRYTHDGSEVYADSFTYVASDATYADTATVAIVIAPKAPVVKTAHFLDTNADGMVDQIRAEFNHNVNLVKMTFKATWDAVGSTKAVAVTTGTANYEVDTVENVVLIPVTKSIAYKTSGAMSLQVKNSLFASDTSVAVMDSAAPVVTSAVYSSKSSVGGDLSITLSENLVGTYSAPFRLISGKTTENLKLGSYSNSGTTYTYSVPFSKKSFSLGDSICINAVAGVADANGAVQSNDANVRQPIAFENHAISAAYVDTSMPADGRIDQIRVTTALAIDSTTLSLIENGSDSLIVLNDTRKFSIDGFTLTAVGFDIDVTESGELVNTAVTAEDRFVFNGTVTSGSSSFTRDTLDIIDSVAPVVIKGVYGVRSGKNGKSDTALVVTFSESVKAMAADAKGNPFGFYDASTASPFAMELSYDGSEAGKTESHAFTVTDLSIDYVVSGDSLNIETAGAVFDEAGNAQKKSVMAPIEAAIEYAMDVQLLVYPQPLVITKEESGRQTSNELEPGMVKQYRLMEEGINENRGVAFIIETAGPLSPNGNHIATAQLLDQTGNVVSEKMPFKFITKEGGNLAGVVVWNGKNKSGRTVGAGSYLLSVEASVETDEGQNSRTIQRTFLKTVGVNCKE